MASALAGAVLLWLPAYRFRIDAASCASWPGPGAGALYALAYAVAVALLTAAWLRAAALAWSLPRALVLGAVVHLVAMVGPPFASNDPLFYAAIGRAMAQHHASATTPLSTVLPPADPLLALLPPGWRAGTSPYGPLFNQLARAIALVGGDDLTRQLRLYQLINVALLVATAALAGVALGARAAVVVLFCPLAVVDGSVNPHNDALLALGTAAFALALARRREAAGALALVATLAVKLSGALLLAFDLLRLVLAPLAARLRLRLMVAVGALIAVAAVAAIVVAQRLWPATTAFTALVGDPGEHHPHFTRSFEALPRALFTYVLQVPAASWSIGLVFRAAGALWLLWCAVCAARDSRPLRWAAIALFGYYLGLHAFLQSWYLLPLLPLATQLPTWAQRPMRVFVVCLTLYYALSIPLDCDARPWVIGVKELAEAALVILPAAFMLLGAWRRSARACAETPRPAA